MQGFLRLVELQQVIAEWYTLSDIGLNSERLQATTIIKNLVGGTEF